MPDRCVMISRAADASPAFPPFEHAAVKATACELVSQTHQPLSRQSTADITRRVNDGLHRPISASSVWRILRRDALQPWRYRYWIFPRDAHFGPKAAAILDLYAGLWQGHPLGNNDFVISSDEKTSIQARIRCHPSVRRLRASPCASNRNINAVAPYSIWRPGMFCAAWCLAAVQPKQGLPRLAAWSIR